MHRQLCRAAFILALPVACLIGINRPAAASDLVRVYPVTDRIIALHFDDGYIDYSPHDRPGGTHREVIIVEDSLDTALADLLTSYLISSEDDARYAGGLRPERLGRKSKTVETPTWPPAPDPKAYVYEHQVYLVLPHALEQGRPYTIRLAEGLAANRDAVTFTFDAFALRSEAVHVNQVGYAPEAPVKAGYVFHFMGSLGNADFSAYEGRPCYLADTTTSEKVFTGALAFHHANAPDNLHGDYWINSDVWACDFSGFSRPGVYYLVVEGVGRSFPFEIREDVYREPYYVSLRGFYHQRSGPARTEPYSAWPKPVDHMPGVNGHRVLYSNFRWMDAENQDAIFKEIEAQATATEMPDAWGGWFDAGDFDRHPEHLMVVDQLLLAYLFHPDAFRDGDLNLPESGNGIPDLLDEARFEVDFFLRLKGPTGGISGGLETTGHPNDFPSWMDPYETWYQYGEEPLASFWTASAAAQLAVALKQAGRPEFAAGYLTEAEGAYTWAQANLQPDELDRRRSDSRTMRDLRMQAAVWLFALTGEAGYHDQFRADNRIATAATPLFQDGAYNQMYAVWAYTLIDRPEVDRALQDRLRQAALRYADELVAAAEKRPLPVANRWDFPTVVGGLTTPRLDPLIAGHYLARNDPDRARTYLGYLYTSADYFLGANPLNMTWMTGIGDRSPRQILHMDAWYDGRAEPVPGIVPYGPEHPRFTWGWSGSWTTGEHYKSAQPGHEAWPLAELWFDSRYPVMSAEFTIWQTMGYTALLYGYLYGRNGGTATAAEAPPDLPGSAALQAAYPNPFRTATTITYDLPAAADVEIALFDALGRKVRTLYAGRREQGRHTVTLDGAGLAGGVYFCRLRTSSAFVTKALMRVP